VRLFLVVIGNFALGMKDIPFLVVRRLSDSGIQVGLLLIISRMLDPLFLVAMLKMAGNRDQPDLTQVWVGGNGESH
jgi:hypothetical protein